MAALVFIIAVFFTSDLGEPMIPLPDQYIDSKGNVGVCIYAACIWK